MRSFFIGLHIRLSGKRLDVGNVTIEVSFPNGKWKCFIHVKGVMNMNHLSIMLLYYG